MPRPAVWLVRMDKEMSDGNLAYRWTLVAVVDIRRR